MLWFLFGLGLNPSSTPEPYRPTTDIYTVSSLQNNPSITPSGLGVGSDKENKQNKTTI